MYLIISKEDGAIHKTAVISQADRNDCDQCRIDIIDLAEKDYPKYYADGQWFYV